jgi:hypothetical protein
MTSRATLGGVLVAALTATTAAPAAGGEAPTPTSAGVVIEVAAGEYPRQQTPVIFELPGPLAAARAMTLTELETGRRVAAQLLKGPGTAPSLAWIVREPLPAGSTRRYRLEPAGAGAEASAPGRAAAACIDDGRHLRLELHGRPVLAYNATMVESPSGLDPDYHRSGQIHPLFTPAGRVVSDDFPPDHAHQHAVFFAWVNTTFQGHRLDFWNQMEQTGRIGHAATLGMESGQVFAQFRVKLRHDDLTGSGGPQPVLDEVWTVRAYDVPEVFLVDFESRQSCAGPEPLTINQYHYGGMGLRGNRQWFDPTVKGNNLPAPERSGNSDFLTSDGKSRATGNHTRPNWVDLGGRIGDAAGGVALLDHPGNFRFPQPVRLHPNKPYFCFAPMVLGTFAIEADEPYVSHYRFVVHDGPADAHTIERLWHDYAKPPAVRVVTDP